MAIRCSGRTPAGTAVVLALLLATCVLALTPPPAIAQTRDEVVPLVGSVVLDGAPVAGSRVTLHRVTSQASGEVDSTLTDATGTFHFELEPVPGSAFNVFFVTAEHLSVRYFGRPIHADEVREGYREAYTVMVYDTVSALPEPIRVTRRDLVLLPELTGSWEVNEIVQIQNPVNAALVATGGAPTWEFRIPSGATDFEAGEGGGILPHEISWMNDRVLLLTPIPPGQRDLFIRYRLPAGPTRSSLQIDEPTDTLNVFVRQPSHLTSVSGLETTRLVDAGDERFLQYGGLSILPGATVQLQWGRAVGPPIDPVVAAVSITLLFLAVAFWAAVRNAQGAGTRG